MNKYQKGFTPILIILIALVVVGGGGVLAWKYKLVEKISSPVPTTSLSPSSTLLVIPKVTILPTPSITPIPSLVSTTPKDGTTMIEKEIVGVLRSSGLIKEEKQKLGLAAVNYQVTDFNTNQPPYGYFLLSDELNDEMLGKCVKAGGVIYNGWKKDPLYYLSNFSVLEVKKIEKLGNNNCAPYESFVKIFPNAGEKVSLSGVLMRQERPAPDIGYDYQLKLLKPFIDVVDESREINVMQVVPATNDIWLKFEKNINKEVGLEGYVEWGYAESRHFRTSNIIEDK